MDYMYIGALLLFVQNLYIRRLGKRLTYFDGDVCCFLSLRNSLVHFGKPAINYIQPFTISSPTPANKMGLAEISTYNLFVHIITAIGGETSKKAFDRMKKMSTICAFCASLLYGVWFYQLSDIIPDQHWKWLAIWILLLSSPHWLVLATAPLTDMLGLLLCVLQLVLFNLMINAPPSPMVLIGWSCLGLLGIFTYHIRQQAIVFLSCIPLFLLPLIIQREFSPVFAYAIGVFLGHYFLINRFDCGYFMKKASSNDMKIGTFKEMFIRESIDGYYQLKQNSNYSAKILHAHPLVNILLHCFRGIRICFDIKHKYSIYGLIGLLTMPAFMGIMIYLIDGFSSINLSFAILTCILFIGTLLPTSVYCEHLALFNSRSNLYSMPVLLVFSMYAVYKLNSPAVNMIWWIFAVVEMIRHIKSAVSFLYGTQIGTPFPLFSPVEPSWQIKSDDYLRKNVARGCSINGKALSCRNPDSLWLRLPRGLTFSIEQTQRLLKQYRPDYMLIEDSSLASSLYDPDGILSQLYFKLDVELDGVKLLFDREFGSKYFRTIACRVQYEDFNTPYNEADV